jgi:hypothetical protein
MESSCPWCDFQGKLIVGNWDQYSDLGQEEKSADILLEWKWNQGLQEIVSDPRTSERRGARTVYMRGGGNGNYPSELAG